MPGYRAPDAGDGSHVEGGPALPLDAGWSVRALADVPFGLLHPSGNRLSGRLELARQILRRASRSHQIDLVEMMAEHGFSLAHTTIMRWIQRYAPEFEKRWNRFARSAGRSWRVDETYVKIKGRWTYLYRAVDKEGKTVDFLLRAKRDVAAPRAFFRLAFRRQGRLPLKITLDGYQASHRAAKEALDEHPEGNQCKIRSSKYLNNLIEQDHRSVKLRLGPMLGLKHFRQAATTIAGIELMHRIRKGQFKLGKLRVKNKTAPEIWNAVLGA